MDERVVRAAHARNFAEHVRAARCAVAAGAFALLAAVVLARPPPAAAASGDDALVHLAAPTGTDGPLLLLLSGDGDWAAFVRDLGEAAAARGSPVVGLRSRTWLSTPRTPEESAALLESAVRAGLVESQRTDVVIAGYSRGADLAPFVVNRWPADLRARVRAIVLVGLSERAGFEFHLEDLFRDVARPTDTPTRPEVEKLRPIPITCVRGADEDNSFCSRPTDGMQALVHEGGHRATTGSDTAEIVLRALGIAPVKP